MKKILSIIVIALVTVSVSKAQLTIHGTTATKFYIWNGTAGLSQITGGEIWVSDPVNSSGGSGITYGTGVIESYVSGYGAGDKPSALGNANPGNLYVSCAEIKSYLYGHGDCGPLVQVRNPTNGQLTSTCMDQNANGCSFRQGNVIYQSPNGDF